MSRSLLMYLPVLAAVGLVFFGLERYIYHFLRWFIPKGRAHKWLLHLPALLLAAASFNLFSTYGILLLHFWFIAMLVELVLLTVSRIGISIPNTKALVAIPLCITALFAAWGFYNMAHPVQTNFTIHTDKPIRAEGIRIALITDVHYDTIQNPIHLQKAIPAINAQHPDVIVLGGDIVEEGTSKERMQEVFRVLGQLEAPIYYIYGNHDQQNYSRSPAYTHRELEEAIRAAGITILADEAAAFGEDVLLYGRIDSSMPGRSPLPDLEDQNRLVIIADHQPNRWKESAAAGGDLQLSGHTHAGQIWPIGQFLELAGGLSYGQYDRDGITSIVSSGFAGWGFTMRTSERCEYAIVDVVPVAN